VEREIDGSELFTIDDTVAAEEIGPEGLAQLQELQQWLQGHVDPVWKIRFRAAPSIVVRSECELWTLSRPRFAFRAYLDASGSFVNARRLNLFKTVLKSRLELRKTDANEELDFEKLVTGLDVVGDSLLAPPDRLNSYRLLTVELGHAYGEGEHLAGTPFVKHMSLGGGMCAQACCLMANALLHEYLPDRQAYPLAGIHGVAEVTAIAQGDDAEELVLQGLRWDEIVRYFARVGRSAERQCYLSRRLDALGVDESFSRALQAYIKSGIPVILPMNFASMYEVQSADPIYNDKNDPAARDIRDRLHKEQAEEDARAATNKRDPYNFWLLEDHAVVVVGCEADNHDDQGRQFLLNDPARLPFVPASAWELYACRGQGPGEGDVNRCLNRGFHAVTPAEVVVTLEPIIRRVNQVEESFLGLFDIAFRLQRRSPSRSFDWPQIEPLSRQGLFTRYPNYDPGSWELRQLRHLSASDRPAAWQDATPLIREKVKLSEEQWCWLQHFDAKSKILKDTLWLWNAERPPVVSVKPEHVHSEEEWKLMGDLLLLVLVKEEGTWVCRYVAPSLSDAPPPQKDRLRPMSDKTAQLPNVLKPALISSFYVGCLSKVPWPPSVALDLYAFMHGDAVLDAGQHPTAVDRLAEIWRNKETEQFAENVRGKLPSIPVAFSTFIPEVFSDRESVAELGIAALCCLIDVADRLGVKVIEMVGGSRIGAVRHSSQLNYQSEPILNAQRLMASHGRELLVRRLVRVVEQAGLVPSKGVSLALELEPGPLYILNSLESLKYVAARLSSPPLAGVVGFSLDIAHWVLAGMRAASLRETAQEVLQHVIHAHISDHGHGHFGDVAIGEVGLGMTAHDPSPAARERHLQAFEEWIDLLNAVCPRPEHGPSGDHSTRFSGYVSAELEATKGMHLVRKSLDALDQLLAGS
jgi:sugar phosphate isomerase/epimerase